MINSSSVLPAVLPAPSSGDRPLSATAVPDVDFWRSIDHNLHLSSLFSHTRAWTDLQKQIQDYLQRPPLLPEEYLQTPYSFFLWDAELLEDYENRCWDMGRRPLTRLDYVQYFLVHAENPADVILLLWDQQDVSFYPTLDGRPSDGFLDGKIAGFPRLFTVRAERWEFLFRNVPPADWLKPLYPVNGQPVGQTLWGRFRRGTDPRHEPDPTWRLHVWTRLALCYRDVMGLPLHPWYSLLSSLPLEWPSLDPDELVHGSVPWLQELTRYTASPALSSGKG